MDGNSGRLLGLGTAATARGTGTSLYIEISQMSTDWFRKLTESMLLFFAGAAELCRMLFCLQQKLSLGILYRRIL